MLKLVKQLSKKAPKNSNVCKSFRFTVDCAKRLTESVLQYAECQTFVQDAVKLELLLILFGLFLGQTPLLALKDATL